MTRAIIGLVLCLAVGNAFAARHLMQIEQVIGGIDGDADAQAVQLRLRSGGQNRVSGFAIMAFDAAGENPIVLITFPADALNGSGGDRILAGTQAFADATGLAVDFTLEQRIPDSYLPAGQVTFGNASGTSVFWSLAWGDAAFTGSNTGSTANDPDGMFNPPVDAPLSPDGVRALLFVGSNNPDTSSEPSSNNFADYGVTNDEALFTNNARESVMVRSQIVFADGGFEGEDE